MAHVLGRKMRLGLCTAVAVLALSFVAPAAAEETFTERYDRFRLFANCEPMDFFVTYYSEEAEAINLTREKVTNSVESRLRSARLYNKTGSDYLSVNVGVYRMAFSISFEYNKRVRDLRSTLEYYAPTWETSTFGLHGNNEGYILSSVSEFMDEFLVEYLRVNEEACAMR